jgi:hypothetical protein
MRHRALILTLILLWIAACRADTEIVAFGLRHSAISNATVTVDYTGPVFVTSTVPPCGDTNDPAACLAAFGASVELGSADAGIFLWPNAPVNDGWSLEGISFGTVNGVTGSLIGSVRGTRTDWATYAIHVDFSSIGATGYVYQAYFHDRPTVRFTNASPDSIGVYSGNTGGTAPRVNPLSREGGRVGAVVDFDGYPLEFRVDTKRFIGTRIAILAANSSANVGDVSRIDIIGSGGLPSFSIGNEQLGKFGLFHQALGTSSFEAQPAQLVITNIAGEDDGVLTELESQRYEALLAPVPLTNDSLNCLFSASGNNGNVPGEDYLGAARLRRLASGLLVTGSPESTNLRVFNNGVFQGAVDAANYDFGVINDSNCVLRSYGAAVTATNEPAHLFLRFASPVTITPTNGAPLTGDELRITLLGTNDVVGKLSAFAVTGFGIGQLTITGAQSIAVAPTPLHLGIDKKLNAVRLLWPADPDYYLVGKPTVAGIGSVYPGSGAYTNFQYYLDVPTTNYSSLFFRLHHYWEGSLFPTD